ncbi:MAG: hypothetical protein QM493_08595 [Sulfurovum sp.]
MYRNSIVLIVFMLSFVMSSGYGGKKKMSDDELIMRGLLYDEYQSYEDSYQIYKLLYERTGAKAYLFKEVSSALMVRNHILSSIKKLKKWEKKNPNRLDVKRLLIPLYLTIRQVTNATREAKALLTLSGELMDLDLASNAFFYSGNFKKALVLLDEIYHIVPKEEILLRMVEIMDEFTNERKRAIGLLESHSRMNIVTKDVYIKLLTLYQKSKDITGILETYKSLYRQDSSEEYLSKIIDVYLYQKNRDGAIEFLETNHIKNTLLYELYKSKKYFTKALYLLDILYNKDKNPKWLAEKAVVIFESAEDKDNQNVIDSVIALFERAIQEGNDDSIYLNYYGYTLVDKSVDIERGIVMIEKALVQQPDNTYYLDSLAWGYYKDGKCKKAYDTMRRVVDEEGLEQNEILKHWRFIKECK